MIDTQLCIFIVEMLNTFIKHFKIILFIVVFQVWKGFDYKHSFLFYLLIFDIADLTH